MHIEPSALENRVCIVLLFRALQGQAKCSTSAAGSSFSPMLAGVVVVAAVVASLTSARAGLQRGRATPGHAPKACQQVSLEMRASTAHSYPREIGVIA